MTADAFEYDVALSFASHDKSVAETLARLLARSNITVFRDEYTSAEVWADDLVDHIVNLYARKARYCLLLVSQHYPLKQWTAADRKHAAERSLRDADEYVLLLRLDDRDLPDIQETRGYHDLRQPQAIASIVELVDEKLKVTKRPSGPPAQSHDLRSGNVPAAPDERQPQ